MSGASNFLARDMLDERRRKRNEFIQRNAVAGVQGAAGGIADYGAMMEQARARRAEQRARRDELTGERDASRADAALEHDRALELIRARGEARPSSARGAARTRSSSTFADKAALKQSTDERQRAIDDAGKRVSMALTVGGLPIARKRADETAKAIAAKYGMDVEDVRRQVSLASTAAADGQEKRFRGVEDQERASAMADTKLDRETAALGMDESKLDGQLNRDGPQFQQANAAEMNAETAAGRLKLAQQKAARGARSGGRPKALPKPKGSDTGDIIDARDAIDLATDIERQLDALGPDAERAVGPIDSRVNAAAQLIGADDERVTMLHASILEGLTATIKRLAGAAVSAEEKARIEASAPKSTDDLDTLRNKLQMVKRLANQRIKRRVEVLDARGLDTEGFKGPSAAPAPGGMVRMSLPGTSETRLFHPDQVEAAKARGASVVK